jgi:hypothetical protein
MIDYKYGETIFGKIVLELYIIAREFDGSYQYIIIKFDFFKVEVLINLITYFYIAVSLNWLRI